MSYSFNAIPFDNSVSHQESAVSAVVKPSDSQLTSSTHPIDQEKQHSVDDQHRKSLISEHQPFPLVQGVQLISPSLTSSLPQDRSTTSHSYYDVYSMNGTPVIPSGSIQQAPIPVHESIASTSTHFPPHFPQYQLAMPFGYAQAPGMVPYYAHVHPYLRVPGLVAYPPPFLNSPPMIPVPYPPYAQIVPPTKLVSRGYKRSPSPSIDTSDTLEEPNFKDGNLPSTHQHGDWSTRTVNGYQVGSTSTHPWTNLHSPVPKRSTGPMRNFNRAGNGGQGNGSSLPRRWSPEEHEYLHSLHAELGDDWATIGERLGRTAAAARTQYFLLRKSSQTLSNLDESSDSATVSLPHEHPRIGTEQSSVPPKSNRSGSSSRPKTSEDVEVDHEGNHSTTRSKWSQKDDEKLLQLYAEHHNDWATIAPQLGRSRAGTFMRIYILRNRGVVVSPDQSPINAESSADE